MLNIKKVILKVADTLSRITKAMKQTPITRTWNNITPTAGQYVTLATLTLPANSNHLIIAGNGNGIGDAAQNMCRIIVSSGTPSSIFNAGTTSRDSSGNFALAVNYVKTGNTPVTMDVQGYGYSGVTGARLNGSAVAIPIVGGGTV